MKKALIEIDQELEKNGKACNDENENSVYSRHAESVLPVFKAMDGEQETVLLEKSCGRVCGEFAYIYPPGIPLLAPGERITKEILETLSDYIKKGAAGPGTGRYRTFCHTGNEGSINKRSVNSETERKMET